MPYIPVIPAGNLPSIQKAKEKGNDAYAKGQCSSALSEYTKGLSYFQSSSSTDLTLSQQLAFDLKDKNDPLLLFSSLLSNRSATQCLLKKYAEALADADEVVKWRPDWVKGYFRRGEALQGLRRYEESLAAFEEALRKESRSKTIAGKIARIKVILEDMSKGLAIHQLFPGRDLCAKSLLAPIQNLIFDYAIQMRNFIYVIENRTSRQCMVVDVCWDVDGVLKYCAKEGLKIVGAIVTHYHFDHVGGLPPPPFDQYRVRVDGLAKLLKKVPTIKAYVNPADIVEILKSNPEISEDRFHSTKDGELLSIPLPKDTDGPSQNLTVDNDSTSLKFIHTPGHTPGSQCVLINGNRLLSGDTLFIGTCGRLDFPDCDKELMWNSLFVKLAALRGEVAVFPGHDYGGEMTTIQREKDSGILKPISVSDFVRDF